MYTRDAKVSLLIVLLLGIMLLPAPYNVQKDSDDIIIVQTIKRVSAIYGEANPQIIKIKKDQAENNKGPMYLIELKGSFRKGEIQAVTLSFSMLAEGKYIWCIRAYEANGNLLWEDDDIR